MNDKDYQRILDLAEQELKNGVNKEEGLRALYNAGILDMDGNFTEMYKDLATLFPDKKN